MDRLIALIALIVGLPLAGLVVYFADPAFRADLDRDSTAPAAGAALG